MYVKIFLPGYCQVNIVQPWQPGCPCNVPHPSAAEMPETELGALGGPGGKVNPVPVDPSPLLACSAQKYPGRLHGSSNGRELPTGRHIYPEFGACTELVNQTCSLGRWVSALANLRQRS